jgi:acid phosphatase (class A)
MNKLSAFVALLLLAGLLIRADDKAPSAAPVYFDPATFDPRALLPAPPPANADETTKEIEIILQAQADRTPEQVARIEQEKHYNVFDFQNVVGVWFTPAKIGEMPATNTLLARVMETAGPIAAAAKTDFNRQRPFLLNSRIIPALIDRPQDPSYPSVHSVRATLDALVLSDIIPGDTRAILARGQEIGDDRVIAGVHFPSDVIAGRKLAQAIYDQMESSQEFQDDVKAARAKVKAELVKSSGGTGP